MEAGSRDEKMNRCWSNVKTAGSVGAIDMPTIFSKMKKMKERKNERNPCRLLPLIISTHVLLALFFI